MGITSDIKAGRVHLIQAMLCSVVPIQVCCTLPSPVRSAVRVSLVGTVYRVAIRISTNTQLVFNTDV